MKKVIILTILALASTMAYAGPVSKEKALRVASKVFAAEPATKATAGSDKLTVVWDGEFEKTKGATDPAFYVVAREKGGFVIVAGNDNVQPVLGFSFENPFKVEDMPDNVRWWMEQIKAHSRSARSSTPEIGAMWARFEDTKASASPISGTFTGEYLGSRTNLWNQTNPANYYCPDVEGQTYTAVCGCVPLAVAEVMAWFGPANITSASGTVAAYTYTSRNGKTVNVPSHELGTVYDWANLKTLAQTDVSDYYNQIVGYGSGDYNQKLYTGANKGYTTLTTLGQNLAHLVYDIGTLLQTSYNDSDHGGTGGVAMYVINRVGPVMGYNNAARYVSMDEYTAAQWEALLKEQIDQHPVLYNGRTESNAGHSYVADGYATFEGKQVFHFNMGWGGWFNGYYYTDIQDDYDRTHAAIIDFYPNPSSSTPLPRIEYSDGGMQYLEGYNTGTLRFSLTKFYNTGTGAFDGAFFVRIEDAYGNIVGDYAQMLFAPYAPLPVNSGYSSISPLEVSPEGSLSLGQQIGAYYKEAGKDTYYPFSYSPKGVSGLTSLPIFPAAFIKTEASYSVGDYFVFQLTNHSYQYDTATWTVTEPGGTSSDYTMEDYHVKLTSVGEYKITVSTPGQEKITAFITVN